MSTNNSREIIACRRQVLSREQDKVNGREQESTRVKQAKTIAKESALEVEEEDNILRRKSASRKISGREEGEKIIVKNASKQNETGQE